MMSLQLALDQSLGNSSLIGVLSVLACLSVCVQSEGFISKNKDGQVKILMKSKNIKNLSQCQETFLVRLQKAAYCPLSGK